VVACGIRSPITAAGPQRIFTAFPFHSFNRRFFESQRSDRRHGFKSARSTAGSNFAEGGDHEHLNHLPESRQRFGIDGKSTSNEPTRRHEDTLIDRKLKASSFHLIDSVSREHRIDLSRRRAVGEVLNVCGSRVQRQPCSRVIAFTGNFRTIPNLTGRCMKI
jgi:hypothetical protein